jgi:hypothetical protein
MKNKILIACLIAAACAIAGGTYAMVQSSGNASGNQVRQQVQTTTANQGEGNQVQVQTQTQVQAQDQAQIQDGSVTGAQAQSQNQAQNQGEAIQLQSNEQERIQNQSGTVSNTAMQVRSQVANAVQEILQVAERNGGIGQQVKLIAQTQTNNQEKLEAGLQKVQSRSEFAKFFIGANYGEINSAKKILQQNREQNQQLNQIKNQLTNQGDQQQLTQQIQVLEQANLAMENSLNTSGKGFSILGWMFKLFAK